MKNLYRSMSLSKSWNALPEYEIRGNQIFRTINHPLGPSGLADYEFRDDGKIYRTAYHPMGWNNMPDYEIRSGKIYRTICHPNGWQDSPDYEIVKEKISRDRRHHRRVA